MANFIYGKQNGLIPENVDYTEWKTSLNRAGAAQQINYGTSLVPAVSSTGESVFLQPSKSGEVKVHTGFMPQNDAEQLATAKNAAAGVTTSLRSFKSDAQSLLGNPNLKWGVGAMSLAPTVPGTPQADVVTAIEQLAAKSSAQALQAMRDASKTGGAVGQVTEREWPRLEKLLANLDRRQSLESFKKNLSALITYLDKLETDINAAVKRMPQTKGGNPTPAAPPSVDDLLKKYGGK
jgi:hypothetical protein